MTTPTLPLNDFHRLAAMASQRATSLGAQLVLAADTDRPAETIARIDGELDRALRLEELAWDLVAEHAAGD